MRRGQGSHSLHQLPGLGPAWSVSGVCAGGDQLHDGAASSSMCELLQCSALSSLLLWLTHILQRQSCVLAPPSFCSSTEVCGEEPMALLQGWAEHTPSHQPCWVSNPVPYLSPFLSSPFCFPSSQPLLSLYPFLNSCLHCALKMLCFV